MNAPGSIRASRRTARRVVVRARLLSASLQQFVQAVDLPDGFTVDSGGGAHTEEEASGGEGVFGVDVELAVAGEVEGSADRHVGVIIFPDDDDHPVLDQHVKRWSKGAWYYSEVPWPKGDR